MTPYQGSTIQEADDVGTIKKEQIRSHASKRPDKAHYPGSRSDAEVQCLCSANNGKEIENKYKILLSH